MAYVKKFTHTLFGPACTLHFFFTLPPVLMWGVNLLYMQTQIQKRDPNGF